MEINDIASAMIIALKYHAIELSEVVDWADSQIKESDNPDINIIELSLAKTESEAVTYLNKIGIGGDKENVSRLFFGYFLNALENNRASYEEISKGLYFLSQDDYEPEDGVSGDMMFFWDGIELAEKGYFEKSVIEVKADMLELLRKYKA